MEGMGTTGIQNRKAPKMERTRCIRVDRTPVCVMTHMSPVSDTPDPTPVRRRITSVHHDANAIRVSALTACAASAITLAWTSLHSNPVPVTREAGLEWILLYSDSKPISQVSSEPVICFFGCCCFFRRLHIFCGQDVVLASADLAA